MTAQLDIGPVAQLEDHLSKFEEVFSPSELDTFQRCRRKHKYGYVLRLGEPGPAIKADAGTVFHGAVAKLSQTNDVDLAVAELNRLYDKLFAWVEPSGFDMAARHKAYMQPHLLKVFLQYGLHVYRNDQLPPISPEYVEIGFIVTIPGPAGSKPAMLYGRMDRVGKSLRDGHIAPLDIKTTGSFGQDFTVKYDPNLQGDLYTYVVTKLFPNETVRGFYIDGVLLQTTKSAPSDIFNRILVPRKRIDLEEFESETYWWIDEIRRAKRDNWAPKSTNQCSAFGECAFRRVCTSHQLQNVIDTYPTRPAKGFHFQPGE